MNDKTYLKGLKGDGSEKAITAFWKMLGSYRTQTQIRIVNRIIPQLPDTGYGREEHDNLLNFALGELAKTGETGFVSAFNHDQVAQRVFNKLEVTSINRKDPYDILEAFVAIRHLGLSSDQQIAQEMQEVATQLLEDAYVREDNIRIFSEKGFNLIAIANRPDDK